LHAVGTRRPSRQHSDAAMQKLASLFTSDPPPPSPHAHTPCRAPPLVPAACTLHRYGGTPASQGNATYGGWTLCADYLNESSHVFSVGIGGDISFDATVVRRHGARVSCFDPTISAAQFRRLANRTVLGAEQRRRLKFYPFGLAAEDDVLAFYHATSNKIASLVTTPGLKGYQTQAWLRAPVLRVQTMQFIARVPYVSVLKMDIEGAEWLMFQRKNRDLREWLRCSPPQQIAIEFHDRFYAREKSVSRANVKRMLSACGYSQRHVNPRTKEEVLFVRDRVAQDNC